jgi:translation initiation factor 1
MSKNSKNSTLVYSDDPKDQKFLDGSMEKKKTLDEQARLIQAHSYTVVFRIEKSGRNGKPVTVIDRFPKHETFLKELSKELKVKCGVGGTYYLSEDCGTIEIQGDQRTQIKKILDLKKIKYKGV